MSVLRFLFWGILVLGISATGCGDDDNDVKTDSGPDTDGDTDGDTDTDTDADTDTDGDGDTDIDPNCDPSYRYPATCIGVDCTGGTACCDGAICNYDLFDGESYISHYCYPVPNAEATEVAKACECGDLAVNFLLDDSATPATWFACLEQGETTTANPFQVKIFSEAYLDENDLDPQTDYTVIGTSNLDAWLGRDANGSKKSIALTTAIGQDAMYDLDDDGIEDDRFILIGIQGANVGLTQGWIWQTMIPEAKWIPGTYDDPVDEQDQLNFDTVVFSATIAGNMFDRIWVEGLGIAGSFTINETGTLCEGSGCTKAEVGFDIGLVAVKSEIDNSSK